MHTCAIYTRMSSELQRETSVQDQEAVARRYAAQHGWTVLDQHVYTDKAISGASFDGRPRVQALMKAAAAQPRPFDIVLVDDSSRLSRDLADAVRFLQLVRFFGVRAIFISQNIDSDHEQATTMVAIHGIVDSLYLTELGKKTKRGLAGQLQRGMATGGRTFGYRTAPVPDPSQKLDSSGHPARLGYSIAVEPSEAATVQHIFERYAAGLGVTGIVEELNRAHAPGPRGEPWRYNAVKHVLRNERYRGIQLWGQRRFERRPGTKQKISRPVPRAEWHVNERPELRIVSDDLWARVQHRLAALTATARRQAGSNLLRGRSPEHHARHLFSSVMRCVCGGAMSITAGGHGSPRYGCRQSWRHGLAFCRNRLTVRAKVADAVLLSELQAQLTSPDVVAYVTDVVSAQVAAALDEGPCRRERLEADRARTHKKLQNLIAGVEDSGATPAMLAAIREREAELVRIDHELGVKPAHLEEKLTVLPSWVKQQLADVAGLLQDEPERARAHFRRIGLSFTVSPVLDAPRPFLRAVGTVDVMKAAFEGEFDFTSSGRSRPRSAE